MFLFYFIILISIFLLYVDMKNEKKKLFTTYGNMQLGEEGCVQIHILVGLFQWGAHTHGKVYRHYTRVGKSTQILGDINSPGGACITPMCVFEEPARRTER